MLRFGFVIATAAVTAVSLAPAASADTLGAPCGDWMKISADPITGEKMFCAAPPGSGGDALTWTAWNRGAWGDAATVGPVGSACSDRPYTFGLSSDGYVVWCYARGEVLLPGADGYVPAAFPSVWSIYSP